MNIKPAKNWDTILVKASGLTLFTVALTWLPQALGAIFKIFTIVCIFYSGDKTTKPEGQLGDLLDSYTSQMTSNAVGEFLAFLILLGISRWIFGVYRVENIICEWDSAGSLILC